MIDVLIQKYDKKLLLYLAILQKKGGLNLIPIKNIKKMIFGKSQKKLLTLCGQKIQVMKSLMYLKY